MTPVTLLVGTQLGFCFFLCFFFKGGSFGSRVNGSGPFLAPLSRFASSLPGLKIHSAGNKLRRGGGGGLVEAKVGVARTERARVAQLLVFGSIDQGVILGSIDLSHSHVRRVRRGRRNLLQLVIRTTQQNVTTTGIWRGQQTQQKHKDTCALMSFAADIDAHHSVLSGGSVQPAEHAVGAGLGVFLFAGLHPHREGCLGTLLNRYAQRPGSLCGSQPPP